MADEETEANGGGDSDEAQQKAGDAISSSQSKKSAKHDSGAADLEKVTDYVEEKEIFNPDDFKGAMTIIGDRRNKEVAEKIAKENELQKVSIKKEDVDLIASELEISRQKAERTLREHYGDVVKALITLTN